MTFNRIELIEESKTVPVAPMANNNNSNNNKLNKTRDSILPRIKQARLSEIPSNYTSCGSDQTMANDNLTNVTNFSQWVTSNESKYHSNEDESEEFILTDKNAKDKSSMVERTLPNDSVLPAPKKMASFTLETTYNNATLYNGVCNGNATMATSIQQSFAASKLSETRKLIDNVFNQTDRTIAEITTNTSNIRLTLFK